MIHCGRQPWPRYLLALHQKSCLFVVLALSASAHNLHCDNHASRITTAGFENDFPRHCTITTHLLVTLASLHPIPISLPEGNPPTLRSFNISTATSLLPRSHLLPGCHHFTLRPGPRLFSRPLDTTARLHQRHVLRMGCDLERYSLSEKSFMYLEIKNDRIEKLKNRMIQAV